MAATITLQQLTGSGPTATNITASPLLFGTDDSYNAGATYGVKIPASGTNYSYETTLRANASGTFTSLSAWKLYSDGANGLGTGFGIAVKAIAQGSYAQATGTQGQTASQMSGGSDLFGYTSGSPLSLTGSISAAGVGTVQYIVLQGSVASTASPGTSATENATLQWDEA